MSVIERITVDPQVMNGRPAIRGMRVRVVDILALLATGASESEILTDYPYLEAEDIRACLRYTAAQVDHPVLLVR